ncbi:hypothetical protein PHISCL_08923 [Aspergillus sclerotialis]|uniref:Zn(2)-C6 fungal-type domain-containing protein n=1 Tax=Aspergillus sclerotialis TaxID=2070753 RepID=A0A3A2Z794_9EURO|nr:hypothetical protein PHISCL_08923 [Aspergillus sclerotialis]
MTGRVQKRQHLTSIYDSPSPQPSNPRSCVSCHRRKVRCDRYVPCKNCVKAGWTCTYPSIQRGRSEKAPSLQDVTDRLERVESLLLKHLEKQSTYDQRDAGAGGTLLKAPDLQSMAKEQPGRPWEVLLRDGERDQYVNNSNLHDLLPDKDHMKPPVSFASGGVTASSLGTFNLNIGVASPGKFDFSSDASEFHPNPQLALNLWATYVRKVDPVLKILHIPTSQSVVIGIILKPTSANPSQVALVFAIYFASVTSLDDIEAASILPESKNTLLDRFKAGLNQALMQADFLNKPELLSLQALAIFLTCLRVHDAGRGVWILNGIAIRLAQSIGLHRDGRSLNLSVFESELRLRLWWHFCLLDSRSPEDHGFELTVDILNQGPRLPLNVNDDQLCPSMTAMPRESETWTEMTFSLSQIQGARLLHPILGTREESSAETLAAKRRTIEDHTKWTRQKYLLDDNASDPLHASASHHYSTACAKMEFILQLREEIYFHRQESSSGRSDNEIRPSFKTACHVLERSKVLLNGQISKQFAWLFKTYTQWYALAYTLRCLTVWPCVPEAEQTWNTINEIFASVPQFRSHSDPLSGDTGNSSIWRCLMLLRAQALRARTESHPDPTSGLHQEDINATAMPQQTQEFAAFSRESSMTEEVVIGQTLGTITDWGQCILPADYSTPFLPEWDAVINGNFYSGIP